ncbi:MAG TPA: haloacid dehalogenase, partial [Candidatus Kapabacteria bacterium]|nr:haloacid dehalogenase [Candidatus Kapabacteria bacterium]
PHEAIMIGDWAERDMVGAKNVGMITGFARYGEAFGAGEVNADYDITDIKQIISIVNQHNTQS